LSITEYCIFDLIAHFATNPKNTLGWCYAKKETIAAYFAVNRTTVFRAIRKGLLAELLEKHPEQPGLLRTTKRWSETVRIQKLPHQKTRSKMRRVPSQNATPKSRKMRRNNNSDNNIYNTIIEAKKISKV